MDRKSLSKPTGSQIALETDGLGHAVERHGSLFGQGRLEAGILNLYFYLRTVVGASYDDKFILFMGHFNGNTIVTLFRKKHSSLFFNAF